MTQKKAEVTGIERKRPDDKTHKSALLEPIDIGLDHMQPDGLDLYSVSLPKDSWENQVNCNL